MEPEITRRAFLTILAGAALGASLSNNRPSDNHPSPTFEWVDTEEFFADPARYE